MMAYDVRSMRERAKQLLGLRRRGVVDRNEQARRMGLSIGHVSRISGWIREHGIGTEASNAPPQDSIMEQFQKYVDSISVPLTVKLSKDLASRFQKYCNKKNIAIDSAAAIAFEHYLKTRPPR